MIRHITFVFAALLIIGLLLMMIAAQIIGRQNYPLIMPSEGMRLETVTLLWPTACSWSYWSGVMYCTSELRRRPDHVLRAYLTFRAGRVVNMHIHRRQQRAGIAGYLPCGGY